MWRGFERLRGKPMNSPHRWETFWKVFEWACYVMDDGYAGSHLKEKPCPAPQYRRVQFARYLIDNQIYRYEDMKFNEKGQIAYFGVDKDTFEEIFWSGRPFITSGCRGKTTEVECNRTFGDSSVCNIKSYPFRPNKIDLQRIRKQLFDYEMTTNYPDILNPSLFRYQ